jgi:UDP-N-acetylmuramate--alanine ligase
VFGKIQHIHFVGIGGIGMSGIAEVLANLGYQVSGSDLKESAVTQRLRSLGITVHLGHHGAAIEGAQVVVISSAVKGDNPEVIAAHAAKIPVIPRGEMLAELITTTCAPSMARLWWPRCTVMPRLRRRWVTALSFRSEPDTW